MALCLAASLIERKGFDAQDQMERYVRWHKDGYMSSKGWCFDIGNTVADALKRYRQTSEAYAGSEDPRSAGNGSLMRLAPVVLYFSRAPCEEALQFAELSSRTTHGARQCLDACRLFAEMLLRTFEGAPREAILFGYESGFMSSQKIEAIARGDYRDKAEARFEERPIWLRAWKPRSGAFSTPIPSKTPFCTPPIWAMTPTLRPPFAARSREPITASPEFPHDGSNVW